MPLCGVMVLLLLLSGSLPGQEQEAPPFKLPRFQTLRFAEDWSVLARPEATDALHPFERTLKYLPFDEEGAVWLSLGGQVRERLEVWDDFRFGAGDTTDDVYLQSRFRLHGDLHVGEYVRLYAELLSAFTTDRDLAGGRRGVDHDELALLNGFVEVNVPLVEDATLLVRGGRQELLLGRQRLVSPLDWANTRRTFDGFSGHLQWGDVGVTAYWVRPVPRQKYSFNDADSNAMTYGIYGSGKVPLYDDATLLAEVYWLALDNERSVTINGTSGDEERHTVGGRLLASWEMGLEVEVEGAWQSGTVGDDERIDAFMTTLLVGYRIRELYGAPRFTLGLDFASGDDKAGGEVNTFNHLFPLAHAYLGFMDFVGRQNVLSGSAGVRWNPIDDLDAEAPSQAIVLGLDGHLFWRAETDDALYDAGGAAIRQPGDGADPYVGAEIDLTAKWTPERHVTVVLGYSHFFPGEFLEETGPSDGVDFTYLIVQLTF